MEFARQILIDPLLPLLVLYGLAAAVVVVVALSIWRGLSGWPYRLLAGATLLLALLNPSLQSEDREPLSDIVLLVVDQSASQRLADREDQTADALGRLEQEVAALGMELRVARVADAPDNAGTLLMAELGRMMAETPRARIAGAILLTDGQLHDAALVPDMPAPIHALLTGRDTDWDRRLVIETAPAFAIIGEEFAMTLRIEDQGAVPADLAGRAEIRIAIDGGEAQSYQVPVGETLQLPLTLDHAGQNVVQFTVPDAAGELTDRNNAAVVQINGIRDRLRVLLVSGEPHPGQRTWRNLLKSDPAVDLVHFTILRPPDKQDGVPVSELSLIAFPTRELFMEAVDEFDLIIFDRYQRRGILPMLYIDNIRRYVEDGGALLLAAGPDFASAASLYRTPLSEILPGEPTARVISAPFLPEISDLGARHPVTSGLQSAHTALADSDAPWGRWLRQIELLDRGGQTVMTGAEGSPLLMLDRVGEGRVAQLASDHAWLWDRGYEGGGPQLELLRRLAHWMMGEPDLEEEALVAQAEGQSITITRRTLADGVGDVVVTAPDGTEEVITLEPTAPGRFSAEILGADQGLYRLTDGDLETVIALGPAAPREFEETIASGDRLADVVAPLSGGIHQLQDGVPDLRRVAEGRNASGRGWIGLTSRDAYLTTDVTVSALLPTWLLLLMAAGLMLAGWLREGRQ
ncbi:Threonine dehydrogenase [Roseibacterium elongatum DSM 19469]|uniref:Threonine dehydrogenase n=1 Tax=Roseicyclus elongatus DSM 19469 TaxID=1294273 RepID=W8SNA9_9RHOB|nr:membrane protein [Roseibacterium elongatum]AHM04000.1 Threonine dehydrogenase [Roseibacterium elongatum DSM 19469]